MLSRHTEGDAWVLVADVLTLLVGEEHVGRETTLWRVGVCEGGQHHCDRDNVEEEQDEPFFFFSVRLAVVALLVDFSLGMVEGSDCFD